MNHDAVSREALINQILAASSWYECQAARQALIQWMKQHPDDWGILDAGGTLEMVMDSLKPPIALTDKIREEAAA